MPTSKKQCLVWEPCPIFLNERLTVKGLKILNSAGREILVMIPSLPILSVDSLAPYPS